MRLFDSDQRLRGRHNKGRMWNGRRRVSIDNDVMFETEPLWSSIKGSLGATVLQRSTRLIYEGAVDPW
jgi:hypothetical protein